MLSLNIRRIFAYFLFGNTHSYISLNLHPIGHFFLVVILTLSSNNFLYAHNFAQNDNSILYTLIKQFEIEKNLASDNQYENQSSLPIHSQRADDLYNQLDFLIDDISDSNFSNHYDILFSDFNLTTKALVSANLADESLREYGLSNGLGPKMAAGLLNMSVDMILKMNETSHIDMNDDASQQDMENMTSMSHDLSTSIELTQGNNMVKNLVNYETSLELAKSLKTLFSNYLEDAKLENSTGLMPIPTEMKTNAIRELEQGIDNLVLALNSTASIEEVYSVVHGQIHPNLFLAFSLKLNSD